MTQQPPSGSGPSGYGPTGYGPPGYGPPGYGGYVPQPPKHPQAVTVLVLGILGIVVCGLIGPFAWTMGNHVVAEIEASGGQWGGHSEATVGRILGIVSTALLALSVLALVVFGGALIAGFPG